MQNQKFTQAQIKWASEHDWFVAGDSQGILVIERWTGYCHTFKLMLDFAKLCAWAGY